MEKLSIHIISDSLGETADKVCNACISQFGSIDYKIKKHSFVNNSSTIDSILEVVKEEDAILIHTLVNLEHSKRIDDFCKENNIENIDLLNPTIDVISNKLDKLPQRVAGKHRSLGLAHYKKSDAIEFSIKYDDGRDPKGLFEADIVLIGVSRTSKTPLSIILATQGFKACNIPLSPELPVPKELFEIDKRRIVGLINDPERLLTIRSQRLKNIGMYNSSDYSSLEKIFEELEFSQKIMHQLSCPIIDTTKRSIEETAFMIKKILKEVMQ